MSSKVTITLPPPNRSTSCTRRSPRLLLILYSDPAIGESWRDAGFITKCNPLPLSPSQLPLCPPTAAVDVRDIYPFVNEVAMSDYHIRRATADDYDGVMEIGDVYFGTDYLRARYHLFMDDPNATSYVYVVGDQIVGFCTAFVIDDGLTFLVRGSRVKKDFQGQGVYGRLMKHVYAEYKGVDSIIYDAMTTNDYNFKAKKDSLKKTHTEFSRKCYFSYQIKMDDVRTPTPTTDLILEEVSSSVMLSLFEDKDTSGKLFPEGKIIIDWVPLRLLHTNMKYILAPNTLALRSRGDSPHLSLLTVGTPIRCQRGVRHCLDVFGNDASVLRHHIIRHLEYLRSLTQENVVFQIIAEVELANIGKDIMRGIGVPYDTPISEMIYFEKNFG